MIKNNIFRKAMISKNMIKNNLAIFLPIIILFQGMKWAIFVKRSTTTKMELNEWKGGRSMMKSMEMEYHNDGGIKNDGENYLHVHKHHMIQWIPSQTSTFVATNNHETLTPWSCWIWNDPQPKIVSSLENLKLNRTIKYIEKPTVI